MLDVLGFRNLVNSIEIDEAAMLLIDLRDKADLIDVFSIQFADSILLYTQGDCPSDLRAIVSAVAKLTGHFAGYLIGLRGGIARGEFWHDNGVFLGRAMIRAHELEQSQDWMGSLLDPEIIESAENDLREVIGELENEGLLVPYRAPIKGGTVGVVHCVGWPVYMEGTSHVELAPPSAPWAVLRKQANTNDFLDWHRNTTFDSG